MNIPIENCISARPYRAAPEREPRRAAMIATQKLADEKWERESLMGLYQDSNQTEIETNSIVLPFSNSTDSFLNTSISMEPIIDSNNEFVTTEESQYDDPTMKKSSGSNSIFAGWFGPTREQKRAQQEFEKWQKSFREKLPEEGISLPSTYLPSALACVMLLGTLMLHALFHLLCHWIVQFRAFTLFRPATKVDEYCHILIVPPPNRGKSDMVPMKKSSLSTVLQVEFQRQVYLFTPAARLGASASKYPNGVFTLYQAPINLPLRSYLVARGLQNESEVEKTLEKWGKNHLAIHIPSFLELLQRQLLAPLAIFQVFCALLWLLDEYWSYTLWSLVSVVMFESTSVFQRTRTQNMLGGMSPKPTPVFVFRCGRWISMSTSDLLPGDLISLAYQKFTPIMAPLTGEVDPAAIEAANEERMAKIPITARSDIVPCDCLLVTGSAIVNEASLTGESVPQMKDAVTDEFTKDRDESRGDKETTLDMNGAHRVHTLFSGTSIITIDDKSSADDASDDHAVAKTDIPRPPDGGALAFVLKTGFHSSQGALLQMIEFSQQSVSGDSREIGYALLLLFCFALVASAYVLREGIRKKEKTLHEILLKCVIIITSVVPKELPMQIAMAVNMALMTLSKAGLFCTEPHRVPQCGKITHCLFDKTGTLTTDQLVPAGIIHPLMQRSSPDLSEVRSASDETAMVLAACHSLIIIEDVSDKSPEGSGNLIGDPIEMAALKGVEWSWDGATSTATPGSWTNIETALTIVKQKITELTLRLQGQASQQNGPTQLLSSQQIEMNRNALKALVTEETSLREKLQLAKEKASRSPYKRVQITQRFHFSSHLQRMSVICRCKRNTAVGGDEGYDWFSLVKGSPEAIQTLLVEGSMPIWYKDTYESLARQGLRVLALAYKKMDTAELIRAGATSSSSGAINVKEVSRGAMEVGLSFAGFIAFECKIRSDSRVVIQSLSQSDHKVMMLTGDALLTSLHVAKQCDICDQDKPCLVLQSTVGKPAVWYSRDETTGNETTQPFNVSTIRTLFQSHNLLTTEKDLLATIVATGDKSSELWHHIECFRVFARMSPTGKATIIRAIQNPDFNLDDDESTSDLNRVKKTRTRQYDHHVLMCGDGGNDVGALKQADVGLALLSGHANTNTTEVASKPKAEAVSSVVSAEDSLNAHEQALKSRGEAFNAARTAHMKKFQTEYTVKNQERLQEEIRAITERGEYMKMWTVMKENANKVKKALEDENRRFMHLHGQIWDAKDGDGLGGAGSAGGIGGILQQLDSSDASSAGGIPMVRPGDASVAAPFTSRTPSVRSVVDLIRQGRCTLLSALMQQQIMMLESIISAYSLSALSLHNARSSERQLMASQWLILVAALSFSYSSPLDHMHPLRPLKSLFHPAIILSILGQAAIHISCMTLAVRWATDAMGPDKLREVTEFFRKVKANEIDRYASCGDEDYVCQMNAFWMAPFLPNLLNSVVFLVQTSQMISVFFANYKGRPWMKGMMENHALFLSVFVCIAGVVVASWEIIPPLNDMLQLTPFPDDTFRYKVVALVLATIAGTFAWDRFCTLVFAPQTFQAIWAEFTKTTVADFIPIFKTVGMIVAVLLLLSTGNIIIIVGAIYWYRTYFAKANPFAALQQNTQR